MDGPYAQSKSRYTSSRNSFCDVFNICWRSLLQRNLAIPSFSKGREAPLRIIRQGMHIIAGKRAHPHQMKIKASNHRNLSVLLLSPARRYHAHVVYGRRKHLCGALADLGENVVPLKIIAFVCLQLIRNTGKSALQSLLGRGINHLRLHCCQSLMDSF